MKVEPYHIAYLIGCAFILFHVYRDCRVLGENWRKYILLVLLFSVLFYLLWLFVWPGSLRLRWQGKHLRDTPLAKANRQLRKQQGRVADH